MSGRDEPTAAATRPTKITKITKKTNCPSP